MDSLGESFNYGKNTKGAISYGAASVGGYRIESGDTEVLKLFKN